MSSFDFIRYPAVYYLQWNPVEDEGGMFYTASGPSGQIYQEGKLRTDLVIGSQRSGFRRLEHYIPIKWYSERVARLSFISHLVAEKGMNKRAYKSFKRLFLVCFTTPIVKLRGLTRKIQRELGHFPTKLPSRNLPARAHRLQDYPFRLSTKETKTDRNVSIHVPLWTWRSNRNSWNERSTLL
jgi:hypothetical protein